MLATDFTHLSARIIDSSSSLQIKDKRYIKSTSVNLGYSVAEAYNDESERYVKFLIHLNCKSSKFKQVIVGISFNKNWLTDYKKEKESLLINLADGSYTLKGQKQRKQFEPATKSSVVELCLDRLTGQIFLKIEKRDRIEIEFEGTQFERC